ncbi:MAG: hypothetical protein V3T17_04085 [Pseudomonadales bacterium]
MKQTGKIELSGNSIIQNERGLWFSAHEKLKEAGTGIEHMKVAPDRISYESGWIKFIDSIEEAWTSFFDEGKNQFPNFQPWAGAKDKQRKSDQLLAYLVQSRHQSQHGNVAVEWEPGKIQVAPNFYGEINDLKIYSDGSFEVEANPSGDSHNTVTLKHIPGDPTLPTIQNKREKEEYLPPKEHLGKKIYDCSPLAVANIAIDYYRATFQEAMEKFGCAKAVTQVSKKRCM